MDKKSTINPILIPLKMFYENLDVQESIIFQNLPNEVILREKENLKVLNQLKKQRYNPSKTSLNIVLNYSKELSKKGSVC